MYVYYQKFYDYLKSYVCEFLRSLVRLFIGSFVCSFVYRLFVLSWNSRSHHLSYFISTWPPTLLSTFFQRKLSCKFYNFSVNSRFLFWCRHQKIRIFSVVKCKSRKGNLHRWWTSLERKVRKESSEKNFLLRQSENNKKFTRVSGKWHCRVPDSRKEYRCREPVSHEFDVFRDTCFLFVGL